MLHRFIAALAVCLLGLPGVAAAQSAPNPSVTPGAREVFASFDAGLSSKVANELSNGGSQSSWSIRGAAELPALGHTFMATLDYTNYSYAHPANNVLPAGIVAACPAGDPGCVTPVGFGLYNARPGAALGTALYVPSFRAVDSETHFGVGTKITHDNYRLYLAAGYLWRTFNYSSMPSQNGFGLGLEKLPDFEGRFSLYGNFWAYSDMHGSTNAPTSALLGTLSGTPLNVDYRMYTFKLGATWSFANSPLFADLNVAGDREDGRNFNVPSSALHTALSLGIGAHF